MSGPPKPPSPLIGEAQEQYEARRAEWLRARIDADRLEVTWGFNWRQYAFFFLVVDLILSAAVVILLLGGAI